MSSCLARFSRKLLLSATLLLGAVANANAGLFCSDAPFNGVVDGSQRAELGGSYAGTAADPFPTQITIDRDCTFVNFSASNPLTATLNFQTNDPSVYLITFNNVIFTGNMACANIDHRIWFVNGADYGSKNNCQDLFIPVEAINKQNPPGVTTVGIGEPFTYTLTIPVLYDPVSGTYINNFGSANDLHSITITDDLNATGADLTVVGTPTVTWVGSGAAVPHTFTDNNGLLTFDINPAANPGVIIPAGEQIQIQITVVADDTNTIGTQFINTATWEFGRLIEIDGVPTFFDPLPGENGVTQPLTIGGPNLVVTKSNPDTALNIGASTTFTVDVQNAGGSTAWDATILDLLPDTADVGMCDFDPTSTVTAQIFAADGTTPVSGVLSQGTDYTVSYTGAPTCELSLTMLSPQAAIGPTERLIITYQSELDADTNIAGDGVQLINIAGATQYYSADDAPGINRITYNNTLTDGSPTVSDFQDRHVISAALSGYLFQKTAQNITTGAFPAVTAAPGDTLRYRVRLFNFTEIIDNVTFNDVLDPAFFDLTTFNMVVPPGAGATWDFNSTTGLLRIFGNPPPLNLTPPQELVVEFEIRLLSTLTNNTVVSNQALASALGPPPLSASSDDPFVNGVHDPADPTSTPDSTDVLIQSPSALLKTNPVQVSHTIGDQFTYRITVPSTPVDVPLYDVQILDNLAATGADLNYVSASVVSGGSWTLTNTGSATSLVLQDTSTGIDIPAGGQAVIDVTVELSNTLTNQAALTFSNTASYTYNRLDGNNASQISAGGNTTASMTVLEPNIASVTKTANNLTPAPGDIIRYSVVLTASGGANNSDVFDVILTDSLDTGLIYVGNPTVTAGSGVSADNIIAAPDIIGDGISTPQVLQWGLGSSVASDIDIVAGTSITVEYDVRVSDSVLPGQVLNNSVVVEWSSQDGETSGERTGADGAGGLNDYISMAVVETVTTPNLPATINKIRSADTYITTDDNVRIGDIVEYTLTMSIPEGTLGNLQLVDTLPQGLDFAGVVSINGNTGPPPFTAVAPFVHADIPAANIIEAGDPVTGPTTVTWNLGNVTNQPNDGNSDNFVIVYRARVLDNVLAQTATTALNNIISMTYDAGTGQVTLSDNDTVVNVLQPVLSVNKLASPAGGDAVIVGGESITYTIDIINNGAGPAYDTVLEDILPVGLDATTVNTTGINFVTAGTVLPIIAPSYDAGTRTLTWNFDSGVPDAYTIPAGETLRITYSVQADAGIASGISLSNAATATLYYSFDDEWSPIAGGVIGVRETYGPSNTASTTLYTGAVPAKTLISPPPANPVVTIGEEVVYQISVPGSPGTVDFYDVNVTDVLDANLELTSTTVSGGGIGVTDNSNLTTGQVDVLISQIPAGQQAIIEVRAVVRDVVGAQQGVSIDNTASYTYAFTAGGPTQPALTSNVVTVTIIEPALTMQKTGPPTLRVGVAGNYTLNIYNAGNATAYDATISDLIPNPSPGGMCDDTPPTNIIAQITQNDLTPIGAPLVQNTDFTVTFTPGSPNCSLTFTLLTPAAAIPADNRLIITYDAYLDTDSVPGVDLTNVAGATEWFGIDTAGSGATGSARTYTRTLTNGTINDVDHEDAHTLTTEAPVIAVSKTVTSLAPGAVAGQAVPGDTLQYTISIQNQSNFPVNNLSLVDDIEALNTSGTAWFAAGSLENISAPATSDTTNSNANGGAYGTGLLDVRDISLGANETIVITFDIDLTTPINNGVIVQNQASLQVPNLAPILSDDNFPAVPGDNDPTTITIVSAPQFQVEKVSTDLTGSASVLLPGDTLRYTITVKNIGNEDAAYVTLRDLVPANTSYLANSTFLNGIKVGGVDDGGVSPLESGILINAPAPDDTAGYMRADPSATTSNVATIVFEVVVNADVLDGTIIANQAYVNGQGAGGLPFAETPSDDPATVTVNDPTLDIVGALPLVDAQKVVQLLNDVNSNGQVNVGDTLRYTITITNNSTVPATGVRLADNLPNDTSFLTNTVYLNGESVPDSGTSPLIAGIDVSSSDQAPPLPTAGNGYMSAGGTAVVEFDVLVISGNPGDVITNQGVVSSNELPDEPTDADGDDSNGDQPTLITIGDAQELGITKTVSVVGGGAALPASVLEYEVTVTNIGTVDAYDVIITDDINLAQMSFVAGSATLNGIATGTSYSAPTITADYSSNYGPLPPGQTATLRFRVIVDNALLIGTTLTNTGVVTWNLATQTASASVSIGVGAVSGVGTLSGRVWHDANFNNVFDANERVLPGWTVQLFRENTLIGSTTTGSDGTYQLGGVPPNYITLQQFTLRFVEPGTTSTTAKLGIADSPYINGLHYITDFTVNPSSIIPDLNLPIDPNGVVYDSVLRTPIAGATLTMFNAQTGNALPATCFDDLAQQGQVTLTNGYYKFDINFSETECPPGGNYFLNVTAPAGNYVAGESAIIPATSNATTAAFSVPACIGGLNDAVPATANSCEVQTFETAPSLAIDASAPGTRYHLHLTLDTDSDPADSEAGESQLFNNHLPIDPDLSLAVGLSKVSSMVNVSRGQLVPYTITINNTLPIALTNVALFDNIPAGFKYVAGSARLEGVAIEPVINGLQLGWLIPTIDVNEQYTVKLLLVVGAGVQEGEYVNRAQVFSFPLNANISEQATATVRVVPDPTFDCSDVIGKVFDDKNLNGHQDANEPGLQGVRLATARGLLVTTDNYGRFHITCAVTPDEVRGSNFILKLDERTLPSGFRVTTENPRVQRVTRGKMIRFNFGATVHRVVRLDVADGVYEKDSDEIRQHWMSRVSLLLEELRKAPSVLRITYLGDVEEKGLVEDRLETLSDLIKQQWIDDDNYKLVIEQEIFWRNGSPAGGGGLD